MNFIHQKIRLLFISPDWSSYQERKYWLCRLPEPIPTIVISLYNEQIVIWFIHQTQTLANVSLTLRDNTALSVLGEPGFHVCKDLGTVTQPSCCYINLFGRQLAGSFFWWNTSDNWEKAFRIITVMRMHGVSGHFSCSLPFWIHRNSGDLRLLELLTSSPQIL